MMPPVGGLSWADRSESKRKEDDEGGEEHGVKEREAERRVEGVSESPGVAGILKSAKVKDGMMIRFGFWKLTLIGV